MFEQIAYVINLKTKIRIDLDGVLVIRFGWMSCRLVDSRYAQGLQHRFAGTGVKVVLIKPGPTDTPMTAHLKGKGAKLAPVEGVAKQIMDAVEAGKPVVYAPGKWWLIMMVIRHLPAFVFNKMDI